MTETPWDHLHIAGSGSTAYFASMTPDELKSFFEASHSSEPRTLNIIDIDNLWKRICDQARTNHNVVPLVPDTMPKSWKTWKSSTKNSQNFRPKAASVDWDALARKANDRKSDSGFRVPKGTFTALVGSDLTVGPEGSVGKSWLIQWLNGEETYEPVSYVESGGPGSNYNN